jgi:hypothetical protein
MNASLSRERDLPDKGLGQASIRVEMDVAPGLVGQPRHLRKRLEQLLAAGRAALADEVNASHGAAAPPETAQSYVSAKQKRRRTRGLLTFMA